jgi:glyoxylase-like metal-dependent hydrolase (beta-lactamase superfamily II)
MSLSRIDAGVIHRTAAFGYRGGSFRDKRDFAMSAVLVKHPRGDLLIDTGFGRKVEEHLRLFFLLRATSDYEVLTPAADRLRQVGYDMSKLRAIILTHAHWDHLSGLPDFPNTPVWITPAERRFITEGGPIMAVARSCSDAHFEELSFESGPYLNFPSSRDVYGDGSVVIVPAPGHTPGSVIVFVTLPQSRRYAFIGDLAWLREGVTEREERPGLLSAIADHDASGVRVNLLRMSALLQRDPTLTIIPAHDAQAFAALPAL